MPRKLMYKPRHEYILVEHTPERSHYVCHPPGGGWIMFLSPGALHEFFEPVGERVEPDVFRENVGEFVDKILDCPPGHRWQGRKILRMLLELGLAESLAESSPALYRILKSEAGGQGDAMPPDKKADPPEED